MLLCKQTALVCLLLCALSSRTTAQNPTSTAQNDPFDRDLLREDVKCVRIPLKKCLPILQYNYTAFPNLLQQRRAQEAQRDFDVTSRLLSLTTGCSDFMIFFVCSMYAPFCQVDELRGDRVLPPCRNMCESARRGCEGLMRRYRFTWPDEFDCERLPEWDGSDKCAGVNDTELAKAAKQLRDRNRGFAPTVDLPTFQTPPIETTGRTADDLCPQPLRVNASRNDYTFGGHKGCGFPCPPIPSGLPDNWYFTLNERDEFAPNWIFAWALLCTFATFATILTFLIDRERFNYPERPIILLAFCYFVIAVIYLTGYGGLQKGSSHNVACNNRIGFLHQKMNSESISCAVQFLVLYLFTIASALWWVILTLTWYLAAVLAWGTEAINRLSQYFHLCAWAIPAILTIVVLALQKVDGDYLSGVCFVGVRDLASHNIFVVAPLLICLLVGTFFLLAGFYSMFRIRSKVNLPMGMATKDKTRLEKFMARIGIFSIMYTVPAAIVTACLIYESTNRSSWETTQLACASRATAPDCLQGARPSFVVFMIKYFMLLLVGTTSGFWIWSRKTLESWKMFLFRCRCILIDPATMAAATAAAARTESHDPAIPRGTRADSVPKYGPPQAKQPMGSQLICRPPIQDCATRT
uniref:Frizzled A1 n=1 Tax=Oscarella lobularis TaxID=121494 RepID=A0A0B5CM76_OSCLO|nr:frizzled A1 [Oscarella lobularis]